MPIKMNANPVLVETAVFSGFHAFLEGAAKNKKLFLLTDENVHRYCFPVLSEQVPAIAALPLYSMPPGEAAKNMETVMDICRFLAEHQAGRDALLINLGGGVVTDTGGFAASVYKRGISFLHIPTTLLAQIDAAIGGKTGVDAYGLKNILGTFALPETVVVYPGFLKTLPERQLLSGYAEALKHALIADKSYWEEIRTMDTPAYENLIARSVQIKQDIVAADPLETGERKKLNFGHTVGHAIESYFISRGEDTVTHGEAVAAGMICEACISGVLTGLPQEEFTEIVQVIRSRYAPIPLPAAAIPECIGYMQNDKKNINSRANFTLLSAIGISIVNCTVEEELVEAALLFYLDGK